MSNLTKTLVVGYNPTTKELYRAEELYMDSNTAYEMVAVEDLEYKPGYYTSLSWDNETSKWKYSYVELPKSHNDLMTEQMEKLQRDNELLSNALMEFINSQAPTPPIIEGEETGDESADSAQELPTAPDIPTTDSGESSPTAEEHSEP